MTKQLVQGYGLHYEGSLVFLHEAAGSQCLNPKLGALESPFEVRAPRGLNCPHCYLGAPPPADEIPQDPMIEAMSPVPGDGLYWIDPKHEPWIWRLSAMTMGAETNVMVWWRLRKPRLDRLAPYLELTNAAPLCVIGYDVGDFQDLDRLISLPRCRKLVVSGRPRLPGATVLGEPAIELLNLDYRALGVRILNDHVARHAAGGN